MLLVILGVFFNLCDLVVEVVVVGDMSDFVIVDFEECVVWQYVVLVLGFWQFVVCDFVFVMYYVFCVCIQVVGVDYYYDFVQLFVIVVVYVLQEGVEGFVIDFMSVLV